MQIPAERDQGFRPLDLLTKEFRLSKPHAEADEGIVRLTRSNTVLEHANQLMIEFGPVNFYPFDTKYAPDGVFDPGEYALSTQISTDQGTIHVDVTAIYADVPNEKSLGQITGVTLSFETGEGENARSSSSFVPRIDLRDPDVAVDEEQQEKEEEELAARALKELPSVADLEKAMHLLFSVVPDALLASGAISNKDNPKVSQGKPTALLGEAPRTLEAASTVGRTLEILKDVPSDQWRPIEYQEVHGPALYVVSGFETPLTLTNRRFNVRLERSSRISPDSMSVPDFLYSSPHRIRVVKEDDPTVYIDFSDFERASSLDIQSSFLFDRLHRDLVESQRARIAQSATQLRAEFNTAIWNADNPEFYRNK